MGWIWMSDVGIEPTYTGKNENLVLKLKITGLN